MSNYSLEQIKQLVNNDNGLVLYFSSEGCSACHLLKPKVKSLIDEKFSALKFVEIKSSSSPLIAAHYSVFAAPTLLVFLGQKEILRNVKYMGISQLEKELKRPYELFFTA